MLHTNNGSTHRLQGVACAACGRVVERKARRQKFCSERCRMQARYLTAKSEFKSLYGPPSQNHSTNPPKNINEINAAPHGIFGPRCAVAAEIIDAHEWQPLTVEDGGCAGWVTYLRPRALREPRS